MKINLQTTFTSAFSALVVQAYSTPAEYFDHALFAASAGSLTIETFDATPVGTVLSGTEFAGVTISARRITVVNPQNFAPGLGVGGANVNSQPHGISASLFYTGPSTIGFDNLNDNFQITFAAPRRSAGLWLGNLGNAVGDTTTPTVVSFYDAQNNLIVSETLQQGHAGMVGSGVNNRIFYGVVTDAFIARIEVSNGSSDDDGILLDDIQYSSNAITFNAVIYPAVELVWITEVGKTYQIQSTADLGSPTWTNVGPAIIGDGQSKSYFDQTRNRPRFFYRVTAQ